MSHSPFALSDFDPSHPANFVIYHETQCIRHVGLVRNLTETVFVSQSYAFFDNCTKLRDKFWVGNVDLEEFLRVRLVVHHGVLVNDVDLETGILGLTLSVELQSELFDVLNSKLDVRLDNVDVEVRSEIVNMSHY